MEVNEGNPSDKVDHEEQVSERAFDQIVHRY
jgi:hypothetical protein